MNLVQVSVSRYIYRLLTLVLYITIERRSKTTARRLLVEQYPHGVEHQLPLP